MLKTLSLVLAGLAAGLSIAFWLQPGSETSVAAETVSGPSGIGIARSGAGASEARLAALEDAFAAEVEQRIELEARVAELSAQLEALGERPLPGPSAAENAGVDRGAIEAQRVRRETFREGAATPEERERRTIDRLIAAGFAPDRAEWINRRTQELRMQAMQAEYEARREGRPAPSNLEATTLRAELGEQDYERFLTAQGRPTSVNVTGVLASSPAERAGLQAGDEIVAYDGKRVFDVGELNELTLTGTSGESVVVDVRRNGQNLQIVLPRGPIGVYGGFRGPPMQRGPR